MACLLRISLEFPELPAASLHCLKLASSALSSISLPRVFVTVLTEAILIHDQFC